MCVCAVSGCQAVCVYVSLRRMNRLYVVVKSSLECPNDVWVSVRRMFSRVLTLVFMMLVRSLKVVPLSNVNPRILGVGVVGIRVLFRVMCGWMLCSLLNGVMSDAGLVR